MVRTKFLLLGKAEFINGVHTWMSVSALVGTHTVMPLCWTVAEFWGI